MKAIILAAGKGTRLCSKEANVPKVLRKVNNKPLIDYPLELLKDFDKKDIIIVVGYMKEKVYEYLGDEYSYAEQIEQLGTGHAVMMARKYLEGYDGKVIILNGDVPVFKQETVDNLIKTDKKEGNDCTLLSCVSDEIYPYGRIIRDEKGNFADIVEDKDCTPDQKLIKETNVGAYVFDAKKLVDILDNIKNNNAQNEYYLTDAPKEILKQNGKIGIVTTYDDTEILGVNTVEDLKKVEEILNAR